MDPLNSFQRRAFRHNIFAHNNSGSGGEAPSAFSATGLSMVWPQFERSYGDFFRDTLIPLGHLHVLKTLPSQLALSGVGFPQAVAGLANVARLCVFERAAADSSLVPRCASACYEELRVCKVGKHGGVTGRDAYSAVASLDAAIGAPVPAPRSMARCRTAGR